VHADIDITGQPQLFRATLCRCGQSKNKPFCDSTHEVAGFAATGERAVIDTTPLAERGGTLSFDPLQDGPLAMTGNVEIVGGSGHTIKRTSKAFLCRCGGSANKPFCDGTHTKIGFRTDN
jgi:CDGSH-type Zn-finger protein